MKTVATLGEILVEIMAARRGQSFREPGELTGPYPSGAPAIFIDQVAKLGQPCGMIGCVGDDDFGVLNRDRLEYDGVDVSAIAIDPDRPTGAAFVTYRDDGERHFVFNIRHSASGGVRITEPAERLLDRCDHFHVMGTSLMSAEVVAAMRAAIDRVRANGGTISFDPNSRQELRADPSISAFIEFVASVSDIVLPSGAELLALAGEQHEERAIAAILAKGAGSIVVKRGAAGASHHDLRGATFSPAFPVEEIDPTGAGDCFGGAYVVCWLRGYSVEDCLRYANASGGRKVTFRGPMEGVSSFAELDAWIAERSPP